MNTANSRSDFVFIIPTFTNRSGLRYVVSLLRRFYPQSKTVICNNNGNYKIEGALNFQQNFGFAKACNLGAKSAYENLKPKYFIFLNDDVDFSSDWVSPCIKKAEEEDLFATTPVLVRKNGSIENFGYKVLPYGKVQLVKNPRDKKIDGLSATALLCRADKFLEMGGFDERLFAYLEDVDLFLRAKKMKLKFAVTDNAKIIHLGQQTSKDMSVRKAYLDFRNWIRLILKNWDKKTILRFLPSIILERLKNVSGIVKSILKRTKKR